MNVLFISNLTVFSWMIPSFDDYPFRMPAPAFYLHMMALVLFVSRKGGKKFLVVNYDDTSTKFSGC